MSITGASPMTAASAASLILHVYRSRWFMIYASFMIMSAAGATYVFAVYSRDIKSTLGYTQQQLNTMSFFKDLGANFGIISGLINEIAPGPWLVLALGSAMNFAGYFLIYLSITGRLPRPALWQLCLYVAVGANSQGFSNTGALVPCVVNFPENRGIVLGLLKGFVGLSGAIFTQLYHAFYGDDSRSLLLLIAWLPAAISLLSLPTIRIIKPPPVSAERRAKEFRLFCAFLYVSAAIAVYLLVVIAIQKTSPFPRGAYIASAGIILLLLLSPLTIVVREGYRSWYQINHKRIPITNETAVAVFAPVPAPVLDPDHTTKMDGVNSAAKKRISFCADVFNPPARGEDYTILQALFSIDMVMIFIATAIGTGGALTAMDNMGQIGESLGYEHKSIGTFVSLTSIWNYAGRVAAGFASEALIRRYRWPRPLMQAVILLVSCAGHALIALPCTGSVYVATVILGFTFGAQTPMFLAMISELFGLKHYSTLFNVGVLSSPVGSYVFNVLVAGKMYDVEARRQSGAVEVEGAALTCMGVRCYRMSFIVITAATLFAAVVMLALTWRTKEFYGGDIYDKFKREAVEGGSETTMADGGGGGGGSEEKNNKKEEETRVS